MTKHGKVQIVIGGQWGSEGKGAYLAWLVSPERCEAPVVVRTGGPQAGHSMIYNGETFPMRMIPVAWHNPKADLVLGPGCLIDLDVLFHEISMVETALYPNVKADYHKYHKLVGRLFIDPNAAIVEKRHHEREAELNLSGTIGSTKEGVGAAQADRVLRQAALARDIPSLAPYMADVPDLLHGVHREGRPIVVESTQGFLLSLTRGGHYPNCTSRDITPAQVLNDAGIPSTWPHEVLMVLRTYPIRIAGPSGEMPNEITWEELAARTGGYVKPEITTVTKKIRRVAEWSDELTRFAIQHCTPTAIVLTFADYWWPHLAHQSKLDAEAEWKITELETQFGVPIPWVSLGFQEIVERTSSIIDIED